MIVTLPTPNNLSAPQVILDNTSDSSSIKLEPLMRYYEINKFDIPKIKLVDPSEFSEFYRNLLVHNKNMTPTLTQLYGIEKLSLHVLYQQFDSQQKIINRSILLYFPQQRNEIHSISNFSDQNTVVEFGCISIYLESLPEHLHSKVLSGEIPFATLLIQNNIKQKAYPSAFFKMEIDENLKKLFKLSEALKRGYVYGRCNTIRCEESGKIICRVVEIMPN